MTGTDHRGDPSVLMNVPPSSRESSVSSRGPRPPSGAEEGDMLAPPAAYLGRPHPSRMRPAEAFPGRLVPTASEVGKERS
jgi:hypothetical protein